MSVQVVRLGAWCDLLTEEEHRDRWGDAPVPSKMAEQDLETFREALHFRVEESATLSDGRRLVLTGDRGWSCKGSGGLAADELWAHLTVEDVERTVLAVVLPDDAEETGEEHPWASLTERLGAHGVAATPEELRSLPYEVILSRRLRARLSAP